MRRKPAHLASRTIFGSAARGEETDASRVDVVVRLGAAAANEGLAYFARLEALGQRLHAILGRPVDVVAEPVRRSQLRRNIETDSVLVF
jgi:uncharacterized protein